MKSKKKWGILIVCIVVIAIVIGINGMQQSNKNDLQVKVAKVSKGNIKSYLSVTGTIQVKDSRDYYSTGEKVVSVNVKVGEKIKTGQLLATFSMNGIEEDLNSDISGTITAVNIKVGQYTNSTKSSISVMNMDSMQIKSYLGKYDVQKVSVGQAVNINFSSKEYKGVVLFIDPATTEETTATGVTNLLGVTISITSNPKDLIPGFDANVNILTGTSNDTMIIPIECLNTDKLGNFVFIVENGKVVKKNIVIGLQSNDSVEVKKGLNIGDQVIKNPSLSVQDGVKVTVVS